MPAEAPREGKKKKKRVVKKTKAITPLQAMMLRMAGTVNAKHLLSLCSSVSFLCMEICYGIFIYLFFVFRSVSS